MSKLNILIVEDESLVALELKNSIEALGYNVVEYATHSHMAKNFFDSYEVDLLLMDINLSEEINGIELYKSLNTTVPVIYLTAYADENTMTEAIQTNPLGYLIKPHSIDELKAILILAKHKIEHTESEMLENQALIKIGKGYFFDTEDEVLLYKDIPVKLTLKEVGLLKLLIEANGKIVKYPVIESRLWKDELVNNTSVRTLIYRLRSKLEHKLIESEFNVGIKLDLT